MGQIVKPAPLIGILLLIAGRCVGGDRVLHMSARKVMCCAVTASAAGVAAATSVQKHENLAGRSIRAVQNEPACQDARFR